MNNDINKVKDLLAKLMKACLYLHLVGYSTVTYLG